MSDTAQGDDEQPVKNPIRRFCKSLLRRIHPRQPSALSEQDDAATATASIESCEPVQGAINRVVQQATFDWGSFFAFEDGSIELERCGVRQRFRDFSELKRNLNPTYVDGGRTDTDAMWRLQP